MRPGAEPCAMQKLVVLQHGRLRGALFGNDAIYAQEQERTFSRVWLFVEHEKKAVSYACRAKRSGMGA